jgi:hypothetical protein
MYITCTTSVQHPSHMGWAPRAGHRQPTGLDIAAALADGNRERGWGHVSIRSWRGRADLASKTRRKKLKERAKNHPADDTKAPEGTKAPQPYKLGEKLTPLNQLRGNKNTLTHVEIEGNHHREEEARKPPPPGENHAHK